MIDSISIALALLAAPAPRPIVEHNTRIVAPVDAQIVAVVVKASKKAQMLATCYESRMGECWSEN